MVKVTKFGEKCVFLHSVEDFGWLVGWLVCPTWSGAYIPIGKVPRTTLRKAMNPDIGLRKQDP